MRRWVFVLLMLTVCLAGTASLALPDASKKKDVLARLEQSVAEIILRLDALDGRFDVLAQNLDEILEFLEILAAGFKPDLVPVGPICGSVSGGQIVAHIRNQGRVPADASTVSVKWGGSGTTSAAVPQIGAFKTVDVVVAEPAVSCFRPDCGITVTVDSSDEVEEEDESNNSADEFCIG